MPLYKWRYSFNLRLQSLQNCFFYSGTRARFGSEVDFITVYIEEAHPSDEDHFKENIDVKTHQNLQVITNPYNNSNLTD